MKKIGLPGSYSSRVISRVQGSCPLSIQLPPTRSARNANAKPIPFATNNSFTLSPSQSSSTREIVQITQSADRRKISFVLIILFRIALIGNRRVHLSRLESKPLS